MTDRLSIEINTDRLMQAIRQAPISLAREIPKEIKNITARIARDARANAADRDLYGTLRNSIKPSYPTPYEGIIAPGVDYAQAVEEGTKGPYRGGGGSNVLETHILDWIHHKPIIPNDPNMSEENLAFVMARSIAHKGTDQHPYMEPALESNRVRAERRLNAAIDRALRTVN